MLLLTLLLLLLLMLLMLLLLYQVLLACHPGQHRVRAGSQAEAPGSGLGLAKRVGGAPSNVPEQLGDFAAGSGALRLARQVVLLLALRQGGQQELDDGVNGGAAVGEGAQANGAARAGGVLREPLEEAGGAEAVPAG